MKRKLHVYIVYDFGGEEAKIVKVCATRAIAERVLSKHQESHKCNSTILRFTVEGIQPFGELRSYSSVNSEFQTIETHKG